MPGGQVSVRTPHKCAIWPDAPANCDTQTLSSPSTATAQGPGRLPPVNGEPGYSLPSGRNRETLPPSAPPCWVNIVLTRYASSYDLRMISMNFSKLAFPCAELPSRFVIQTFPLLSMASPLPL